MLNWSHFASVLSMFDDLEMLVTSPDGASLEQDAQNLWTAVRSASFTNISSAIVTLFTDLKVVAQTDLVKKLTGDIQGFANSLGIELN